MRERTVLGLVVGCAVVIAACGSKDPDTDGDDDAGRGGGGRGGSQADAGGDRDGGGQAGKDSGQPGECEGAYLPIAVGNSWTYDVINPVVGKSTKVNTIEGEEKVGGTGPNADVMAFHAVTRKTSGAGEDMTESWQGVLEDGSVVRYREIAYAAASNMINGEEHWEPYKLRIDNTAEHLEEGASWAEQYRETKIDNGVPLTADRSDGWVVEAVDEPCGPVHGEMLSCIRLKKSADGSAGGKTYWYAPCVGKVREMGTQIEQLVDYELH
jgi:hypothetical protein